jgi:hypothetical protein
LDRFFSCLAIGFTPGTDFGDAAGTSLASKDESHNPGALWSNAPQKTQHQDLGRFGLGTVINSISPKLEILQCG